MASLIEVASSFWPNAAPPATEQRPWPRLSRAMGRSSTAALASPRAIPPPRTNLPAARLWSERWSALASTSRPLSPAPDGRRAPSAGRVSHERHSTRSTGPSPGGPDYPARGRAVCGHGQAAMHLPITEAADPIAMPWLRALVRSPPRASPGAWRKALGMAVCRPTGPEMRGLHLHEREHRGDHDVARRGRPCARGTSPQSNGPETKIIKDKDRPLNADPLPSPRHQVHARLTRRCRHHAELKA